VCTLYSNSIREVVSVDWQDFIPHYRLVKLRVENLGPGTVGIDASGRSLYDELQGGAQDHLEEIMRGLAEDRATFYKRAS
jgi:fumarate hydratase subunit beta